MGWISKSQQDRDHSGLRDVCAADGKKGSKADPLGVSDTGSRVHKRHFEDPKSGFFGGQQKPGK
ncbi:MAG: hypothetical protein JF597_01305 [Streptomyces sp.]|uniref:hypothetical protein n=1 Tax=Streptomyces sp. TaxID=1931 RepID=UPI0025FD13AD|nr:hypothetical protein [Streptomyces sp.]MBW8792271.1 hypothetical protein [Streptomyces sp.]